MTALHGVWITSVLGAILFWLAGYLLARGRASKGSGALEQRLAQQAGQLDAAQQEQARLEQELASQAGKLGEVSSARDTLAREVDAAQQKISAAEEQQEGYRQEAAGVTSKVISLETERDQLRQEVDQLNSVLSSSMKERDEFKTALSQAKQDLAYVQGKAMAAEQEVEKVRAELSEFSSRSDTREVEEITETGANVRAALLQSEEKRRSLHQALLQSQTYQNNLSARVKKHEDALAEAHQEIGSLQVELARAKEELQAARSEVTLKSNRLAKLERNMTQGDSQMGELDTTPGGTGMPLSKKTLSILLERTRSLQAELNEKKEQLRNLETETQRQTKLEQLLSAMKSRLDATENRVMSLEQERDRLTARLRTMGEKRTLPGGFDGP